ncbi:metallophosphoesterase [Sedimentisphaera salicampi]|uniref:metallophosphoesterase n=1 Tax=Sedimentisphaera salicampi TaxID=1941349 RepID=UPI000B9B4067|nr:metallophosphoesterase [Sedimentisphaera salicampi]OXU14477.1 UDP-2,3-diacylglucosamine hydrolase [Sedimentisphaera salicampi]
MKKFRKRDVPLYIVSDLHIGSGKSRDNFSCPDKMAEFHRFLNEVDKEDGQIIILGDFMDLWRFSFKSILKKHDELISRLGEMDCYLIPGNHDLSLNNPEFHRSKYPLFDNITYPFSMKIGERDIAFWHGHEMDMLNKYIRPSFGKTLGHSVLPVEHFARGQIFNSDVIVEGFFRVESFLLAIWNTVVDTFIDAETGLEKISPDLIFSLLARKHNAKRIRKFEHQSSQQGKTVISAHTHQAGMFGNWYFNSGSWTTSKSDFLKIWPTGNIDVLKWNSGSQAVNNRILA